MLTKGKEILENQPSLPVLSILPRFKHHFWNFGISLLSRSQYHDLGFFKVSAKNLWNISTFFSCRLEAKKKNRNTLLPEVCYYFLCVIADSVPILRILINLHLRLYMNTSCVSACMCISLFCQCVISFHSVRVSLKVWLQNSVSSITRNRRAHRNYSRRKIYNKTMIGILDAKSFTEHEETFYLYRW